MAEGTTISSLQIQIEATTGSAERSLDDLKKALEGLKSSLGSGGGLSGLVRSLQEVGEKAENLGTTSAQSIEKLIEALKDLQGVGKLNLNDTAEQIDNVSRKSDKAANSVSKNAVKIGAAIASLRGLGRTIASLIDKSNTYVEDLNLFNASLGKYASSAQQYAEQVGELMGIDPAKWMRNQGIFQTLGEGFGVASDRAVIMSKNLTQLGYDLSSFFNIAVEGEGGAMQKLQAAFSGELEPLRRLGFDLSEARLKSVALKLGIDQTFNSMTQAQKAQLRYYAIMTQVTEAQGDMARTLETPANQLRIFKAQVEQAGRALGNIFIPALNAILPYCIAAVEAIRMVANAIAELVGFSLPEIDYSGIEGATGATDDLDDSLKKAGGSAKKLNELLADWDELNIIQSQSGGGGGGSKKNTKYNPEDWKFDLPEYDFLKDLTQSRVQQILEGWKPTIQWITDHMEEILKVGEAVGAALLSWKLAKGLLPGLTAAGSLLGGLVAAAAAAVIAIGSIELKVGFTTDWLETGNWGSLLGSAITTVASTSLLAAIIRHVVTGDKGAKLADYMAGTLMTVQGFIDLSLGISDVIKKGWDYTNIYTLIMGGLETTAGMTMIGKQIAAAITGQKITAKQTGGVAGAALSATANVTLDLWLTQGGLVKGDIVKILSSIGTNALTAAFSGMSVGMTFKDENGKFNGQAAGIITGIVLAADSIVDLYLGVGDLKENGLTLENFTTVAKGALEAAVAAGLITNYAIKGKQAKKAEIAGTSASVFTALANLGLNLYLTKGHLEENSESISQVLYTVASDAVTAAATGALVGMTFKTPEGKFNGKYAGVVSGVMLVVDAAMDIYLAVGDIAENGITEANMSEAIKGTMEAAIGAGLILSYGFKGSFDPKTAGAGAATALLAAAGVGVSYWLLEDSQTQESATAANLEVLGAGLSSTLTAAAAGYGIYRVTGNKKYGFLMTGVTLGVNAAITSLSIHNKVSDKGFALNDTTMWWTALKGLIEGAAAGAGIALTIGKSALVGGAIGAGISLALTVGAVIVGIINNTKKSDVGSTYTYGEGSLSEAELQDVVNSLFNFDVKAHINSITTYTDDDTDLSQVTASVNAAIEKAQDKVNGFVLGINKVDTMQSVADSLIGTDKQMGQGSIIGDMKLLIEQNQIPIRTLFSSDGKLDASEQDILKTLGLAGQDLSGTLTMLGNTWAQWASSGFSDTFKDEALKAFEQIMAITKAYTAADLEAKLDIAMSGLGIKGVNKDTVKNIMAEYKTVKDDMWEAYKQREDDAYTSTLQLLRGEQAKHMYQTEGTEEYKQTEAYIAQLNETIEEMKADRAAGYQKAKPEYDAQVAKAEKQLIELLSPMFQTEEFWEEFQSKFNEIYGSETFTTQDELKQALRSTAAGDPLNEIMNKYLGKEVWKSISSVLTDPAMIQTGFMDYIYAQIKGLDKLPLGGKSGDGKQTAESVMGEVDMQYQALQTAIEGDPIGIKVDTTDAKNALDSIQTLADSIDDIEITTNVTYRHYGSVTGWGTTVPKLKAEGGFVDTGELFVAREAGPELVGRIGRSTAVANNEQIETGIASGVRSANQEQNDLLRQQNRLLTAILAKTGHLEPSTALARTLKRSNEMMALADGV